MSTFRNVFAAVAMVLFVGLAVAPTLAMADEAVLLMYSSLPIFVSLMFHTVSLVIL